MLALDRFRQMHERGLLGPCVNLRRGIQRRMRGLPIVGRAA
jgi:hypothetical protein